MAKYRNRTPAGPLARDASWTLLGPGTVIQGDLLLTGDVFVHGRIEGTLYTDGTVTVAEGGSIEGGVRASRIVVEGACFGILEGTGSVELRPGCLVQAEIETPALGVAEGARFHGHRLPPEQARRKPHPFQLLPPGQA